MSDSSADTGWNGHRPQPPETAEQAARRSESHLRLLADSLPALVAYVDRDGRYRFNNAAYEEWFGVPVPELRGKPVAELLGAEAHKRLWPHAAAALAGRNVTFETVLAHARLGQRPVRVGYVPHRDTEEGPVLGFYSLITDTTDNTGPEWAGLAHVQRATALGDMVTSLAHDLSQPLGAITSYVGGAIRMLHTGATEEEIAPVLRSIAEQARSATSIVHDVREFVARSGDTRVLVDINGLLRKSLSLTEGKARQVKASVHLEMAARLHPVRGDPVQLEQVLVNLITNALEAMDSASAKARKLVLSSTAPEPDQIEIAVRDTGKGIAAGQLAHIFDAFYTTKLDGMGVGLYISHSIAEAHGGRLWAESSAGQGASFYLRLPTAQGGDRE